MSATIGPYVCYHCGNKTPHRLVHEHSSQQMWDQIENDIITETFKWFTVICTTCEALSLRGGFALAEDGVSVTAADRLYPIGPEIVPPRHAVSPPDPVPEAVVNAYAAAWPLRHINPGAFANQIRRCLEFICNDQKAKGATLGHMLKDLAARGILPKDLITVADLLRDVGNIASHANAKTIDAWDAELVDELFKTIVRYIYIAPAQVRRMRQRLA
jgi:hypothetical protein